MLHIVLAASLLMPVALTPDGPSPKAECKNPWGPLRESLKEVPEPLVIKLTDKQRDAFNDNYNNIGEKTDVHFDEVYLLRGLQSAVFLLIQAGCVVNSLPTTPEGVLVMISPLNDQPVYDDKIITKDGGDE